MNETRELYLLFIEFEQQQKLYEAIINRLAARGSSEYHYLLQRF